MEDASWTLDTSLCIYFSTCGVCRILASKQKGGCSSPTFLLWRPVVWWYGTAGPAVPPLALPAHVVPRLIYQGRAPRLQQKGIIS